jgi:phosphoglycolate phosphatase/putative hydrolase of the HAD superfamily
MMVADQSRTRIRAVVMDVDGTLYSQSLVRRSMALRLLKFTAFHPREGWRALRAIKAYRDAQEQIRTLTGSNIASHQIDIAASRVGESREQMKNVVLRWMENEPLDAVGRARFPGVVEFCEWAQSSGISLAVLSDYPAHSKLKAMNLTSYIPVVVSAQDPDVDCFKPNPNGLLKAIRQIGVSADEAIYVGDRPEVDLEAAAAAGVRGVLVGTDHRRPTEAPSMPSWAALKAWVADRVEK